MQEKLGKRGEPQIKEVVGVGAAWNSEAAALDIAPLRTGTVVNTWLLIVHLNLPVYINPPSTAQGRGFQQPYHSPRQTVFL